MIKVMYISPESNIVECKMESLICTSGVMVMGLTDDTGLTNFNVMSAGDIVYDD